MSYLKRPQRGSSGAFEARALFIGQVTGDLLERPKTLKLAEAVAYCRRRLICAGRPMKGAFKAPLKRVGGAWPSAHEADGLRGI